MQFTHIYHSPLGDILLACDDIGLTGLWFTEQKHFASTLKKDSIWKEHPIFTTACLWLDEYFHEKKPSFTPPLHFIGTPFQVDIWNFLLEIPYGETLTYGQLATKFAQKHGLPSMSAQAVGQAVGRNPISIIVPCHRVIGKNRNLTGYAGGIDKKEYLLTLENRTKK